MRVFIETPPGDDPKIPRSDFFQVALYSGLIRMNNISWLMAGGKLNIDYPFSNIDKYPNFGTLRDDGTEFNNWVYNYWHPTLKHTLKIEGENGIANNYKLESIFDTTKEYIFIIPDNPDIKASNQFQYNNMLYLPISFEREKSNKKTSVKGRFYRMLTQ